MITENDKKWIRKKFPQKAKKIIKYLLDPDRLTEAGIELYEYEYFSQVPRFPGYYGSTYGRCVSLKGGAITLLKRDDLQRDVDAYVIYTLSKPRKKSRQTGVPFGKGTRKPFTAQQLVGEIFLPDYWPDRVKEVHHIDHNKRNNRWTNLVVLPVDLHWYANRIEWVYVYLKGKFRRAYSMYALAEKTGLSFEDVYLCLKRQPDKMLKYSNQNPIPCMAYNVKGWQVVIQLTDEARARYEETGKIS